MPTNQDVIRLLEAAQANTVTDDKILEQMTRIMAALMEMRGQIMSMAQESQRTQQFYEDQQQEQPREWGAFGERWRQGTPTPLGDTSPTTSPERPGTYAEEIEMGNTVEAEGHEGHPSHTELQHGQQNLVSDAAEMLPENPPRTAVEEMPTPRRLPLAYAPGGVDADPVQALRNASRSSQERARRGAATRPFRSGR